MNRGSERGEVRMSLCFRASMRPRFMNRGSGVKLRGGGAERSCFNEAPIHESGK